MNCPPLTNGAVRQLIGGAQNDSFQPTLQVINIKQVPGGGSERFRVVLSDGSNFINGMLATQINDMVRNNALTEFSIVTMKEYIMNCVNGKHVCILMNMDVHGNPGSKIGNPSMIEESKPGGMGAIPQAQSAQPMYQQSNSNPIRQPLAHTSIPNNQMNNNYSSPAKGNPYGQSQNRYNNNNPASNRFAAPPVTSSGSIVRNNVNANITMISQLNMYQNRWTIKARCTSKSPVKTWSNARGDGSLFSIELLDASGTDIRATFFKEAVDKFHPLLDVDKVYTFSGGRLKVANQQWNTCKSQFEITFDQNAEIRLIGDDASIQHNMFEFKKIAELENVPPNSNVDLLCVVKSVSPVGTVVSKKTGQELFKSDMTVVDDSGAEVNLTVWGENAKTAEQNFSNQPIVAFKNLRVSDFGGRSLSANASGAVLHYPKIPETNILKNWWTNQGGATFSGRSLSNQMGGGREDKFSDRKMISTIKTENLGHGEKPDWITFKATINFIKKDREGGPWYTACANPDEPCKNRPKVTNTVDGQYHCEKCNQTYQSCVRRYIFSAALNDDTGNTWVSIFDEQANQLLGGNISAEQMNAQCFEGDYDTDAFESYFAKVNHTDWVVTCKVKNEVYGEDARVKCTAYKLNPVDYAKESRDMLEAIMKF